MADVQDVTACKRRALLCAQRAAACNSPAGRQKFSDLALTWLMLAAKIEEQWQRRAGEHS